MIQPLKPTHHLWVVEWVQCDEEPALVSEAVILPVVVLVVDAVELEVIGHLCLPEIDQRKIEALLTRLLNERTPPREVLVPARDDWNREAWTNFASDFSVKVEFSASGAGSASGLPEIVRTTRRVKARFARQVLAAPREACARQAPAEVVEGLFATSRRLHSAERRTVYLRTVLSLDAHHAGALLDLADLHYQQGDIDQSSTRYAELLENERRRWKLSQPDRTAWWSQPETRPLMKAHYGLMMCDWQRGELEDALHHATTLLQLNPTDNQGVRFLIPLLHLLTDNLRAALEYFRQYESRYPGDYHEPSFDFAWGFSLAADGAEAEARRRYRQGMLRNIYLAPVLLDIDEPPADLWHPTDRSEPEYAYSFFDSYGMLWERDHAALRFLRDTYQEALPLVNDLIALRRRMADFQDERYDPGHKQAWDQLLDEERALLRQADEE